MQQSYCTEFKRRGATWGGPSFRAESWEEAQALAATYPVKGLTVIGRDCCTLDMDMYVETYHFDAADRVTLREIEVWLKVRRPVETRKARRQRIMKGRVCQESTA